MKKLFSALIAAVVAAGSFCAVPALAAPTATVYCVEDFESYEPGTYTSFTSGLGNISGAGCAANCTFEIKQEANGNKYLKVNAGEWGGFGYSFGSGSSVTAFMNFDYFYDDLDNAKAFVGYGTKPSGDGFWCDAQDGGRTGATQTNTNAAVWTKAPDRITPYNMAQNIALVVGINGTAGSICIDNVIIWGFDTDLGSTHNVNIPATVTFADSVDASGATMPNAFTGCAWCNLFNAQNSFNPTLNLNSYKPTGAPAGKEFAGWSLTKTGNVIKDTMYSTFRIPGNITLYAQWKAASPVVKKEDFEGFTVGQTLSSNDLAFLTLNQHAVGTYTATVKADANGNKYLEIATVIYGGILVKNRPSVTGNEYLQFNYRYPESAGTNAKFTIYAGSDHTGSNQRSKAISDGTYEWKQFVQGSQSTYNAFGGFFDGDSTVYTIELDDIYYWHVPTGVTEDVTLTFANSTTNAPTAPTLPESVTKAIFDGAGASSIDLDSYEAQDPSNNYKFVGWSYTDGGSVVKSNSYRFTQNETLYAVWEEKTEGLSYSVASNTVTVSGVVDLTEISVDSMLVLACYKGGRFVGATTNNTLTEGQKNDISDLTCAVVDTPDTVKAFIWSNDGNISRLKPAITVNLQ